MLAAGLSKRFGRNKLLEKVGNSTMIKSVVQEAVASTVDEVIVVLGYEAERIKEALKDITDAKCKYLFNEDFETGQSSSVKAGVKSVMNYADAVMILPADVAMITSAAIDQVAEEYTHSKDPIVVSSYKDRAGHPILFDRSLFNEIVNIKEETKGLKAVVNRHLDLTKKVESNSDKVLIDIDTEQNLRYFNQ